MMNPEAFRCLTSVDKKSSEPKRIKRKQIKFRISSDDYYLSADVRQMSDRYGFCYPLISCRITGNLWFSDISFGGVGKKM